MEDTFDYPAGPIDGSQNGGIGFSGGWIGGTNGGVSGTNEILEESLLFSDYPTNGNRVRMANVSSTNVNDTARQYSRTERTAGITKDSGELWTAFLYQRIDPGGELTDQWVELRNNANFALGMSASVGNSFDFEGTGLGIRPRYDSSPPEIFDDTKNAQNGDVYLMIGQWTQLNILAGGGVATMWALTESDYDTITADGSIDAAELDANNFLRVQDTTGGFVPQKISPGNSMRWVNGVRFVDLAADFDEDADVDGKDFLNWQRGHSTSGANLADGDADGNGTVDSVDLGIWANEFGGQRYGSSIFDYDELRYGDALEDVVLLPPSNLLGAAVPEPSSLLLTSLAVFLWVGGGREKSLLS